MKNIYSISLLDADGTSWYVGEKIDSKSEVSKISETFYGDGILPIFYSVFYSNGREIEIPYHSVAFVVRK